MAIKSAVRLVWEHWMPKHSAQVDAEEALGLDWQPGSWEDPNAQASRDESRFVIGRVATSGLAILGPLFPGPSPLQEKPSESGPKPRVTGPEL